MSVKPGFRDSSSIVLVPEGNRKVENITTKKIRKAATAICRFFITTSSGVPFCRKLTEDTQNTNRKHSRHATRLFHSLRNQPAMALPEPAQERGNRLVQRFVMLQVKGMATFHKFYTAVGKTH